jgi:hypothetical protein
MVSLGVAVYGEFVQEMAQVPFPEDNKVFEAFYAERPDEPVGVRVAVRLLAGMGTPLTPPDSSISVQPLWSAGRDHG